MRVLVIVPTYDERENVEELVQGILGVRGPDPVSVLVVDDNSPDGTAAVVRAMMAAPFALGRLHLLIRESCRGLGGAYVAGLSWGIQREFDLFVEMDADLSHDPRYLPGLIEAARHFDFVVGSRYVPGGGVRGWGWPRRLLIAGRFPLRSTGAAVRDPRHDRRVQRLEPFGFRESRCE